MVFTQGNIFATFKNVIALFTFKQRPLIVHSKGINKIHGLLELDRSLTQLLACGYSGSYVASHSKK